MSFEKANNKNRIDIEELGLHAVLIGVGLFVIAICIGLGIAILAIPLMPTSLHRLGALAILLLAILYTIKRIRATYYEFFVTRRSRR